MRTLLMMTAFLGASFLGMLLRQRTVRRVRVLEETESLLRELRVCMLGRGDAVPEALERLGRGTGEGAKMARSIAAGTASDPGRPLEEVWREAVCTLADGDRIWMALKPEDAAWLGGMGAEMTVSDRTALERSMNALEAQHALRTEAARKQAETVGRTAQSVGVVAGLILVILML